jgi:amino acid transporter
VFADDNRSVTEAGGRSRVVQQLLLPLPFFPQLGRWVVLELLKSALFCAGYTLALIVGIVVMRTRLARRKRRIGWRTRCHVVAGILLATGAIIGLVMAASKLLG